MPSNEEIYRNSVRKLSPAQKLKQAERLYWSARALKAAYLRATKPNLTDEEIAKMVKEAFMYAR